MTEKGRRLTIERINKYREEADKEKKKIIFNVFMIGLFSFLLTANSNTTTFEMALLKPITDFESTKLILPRLFNYFLLSDRLKALLQAISRKTGIEINIGNLEAQLKLDEFEQEVKGKNR